MQQGLYVSLCWAITSGEYFFKEVEKMTLEARLISNSNAFFARQDRSPLVADEYDKQFQIALMQQKKPLPTAISND